MKKILLPTLLILGGCASLTPHDTQQDIAQIAVPDAWLFAPVDERAALKQEWWREYGSDELNQLIERALAHNHNLRDAALNWQKARLGVSQNQVDNAVQFSGSASGNISRPFDGEHSSRNFGSSFSASYQLDLWQKLGLAESNAVWQAEASNEDLLAVRLSLIGDVVRAYFNLAWLDDQIRLNQQTLAYQQDSLKRMRDRFDLGDVAQVDVVRSEQALNQQQINAANLSKNRQEQLLQLATLLGEPPQLLTLNPPPIAELKLPDTDAPLPASLLRQRPDLRAAQYRLQQQLNDVSIAERAFYPDINLSAGLSGGGIDLAQLLSNPVGSLGTSLSLPFLQSHKLTLNKQQSELNYQQALNDFEQKLYRALQDVNSALLTRQSAASEQQLLQQSLQQTRKLTQITKDRYQLGADSLQTLLDAEQSQRDAEQALLANRHAQLNASVDLALALGGGQ